MRCWLTLVVLVPAALAGTAPRWQEWSRLPVGTEVTELRTADSRTVVAPGGRLTTTVYAAAPGALVDSDTTVHPNHSRYVWKSITYNVYGWSMSSYDVRWGRYDGGMTGTIDNRGFARFDLSPIPDGSDVTAATLGYTVYQQTVVLPETTQVRVIPFDPVPASAESVYNGTGGGVLAGARGPTTMGLNALPLNTAGVQAIEDRLSSPDWIAIGWMYPGTSWADAQAYSYSHANRPYIAVTYGPAVNHDVGVTRVLAPVGMVDSGQSVVPACSVYNWGAATESYLVRLRIGSTHTDTARVTGHAPGTARLVSFPAWTARVRGWSAVRCSTELAGDLAPANDRRADSVLVAVHDIAAVAVVSPGAAVPPGLVVPAATVRNNGTARELARVFYSINSTPGYSDSVVLSSGLPFADTTLAFAPWNATPGSYAARCSVYLVTDQVRANDTAGSGFTVNTVDVGVLSIESPADTVDTASLVLPAARVRNYGAGPATFRAWLSITGPGTAYADSVTITGLASGDSGRAAFRAWPGPHLPGAYAARCSVWIASDGNALNDTLGKGFVVHTASPPLPPGWVEVGNVPLSPSGKAVKDGGWVAYDARSDRFYGAKAYKTGDFYCYDAAASAWAELTPWPLGTEAKPPYKGAVGSSDGNGTIYATKGNNRSGFWKYSVLDSAWTQLEDVPLGLSNKKVKGGTDMVYVAGDTDYVYLLKGYKTEFYRYNIAAGAWQALADAPAGVKPKWDKGSWLVYDEARGRLLAHKAKYQELYAYDLAAGTWGALLPGMPPANGQTGKNKKAKDGSDAALLDGTLYALKGGNTQDFYSLDLETMTWAEQETIPAFGSTGKKKRVKGGGSIAADGEALYALKGNKTREFWRYVPGVAGESPNPKPQTPTQGVQGRSEIGNRRLEILQNPAVGSATIRWSGPSSLAPRPSTLSLYDASGRLVYRRAIDNRQSSFDIALSPGVYLVRVTGGENLTRKLVIE
ncbi:MAG: T9SS type A sorting domain-containing protein [bacterium]